ncbi:MAG: hypothetical protein AAB552_02515 [Patescibacteria group bacterium]
MNKKNYIVVESSENDDAVMGKDIHTEDEALSIRTMHDHGVVVEKQGNQPEEATLNEDATRTFLSQNGIEIIKEAPDSEKEPT